MCDEDEDDPDMIEISKKVVEIQGMPNNNEYEVQYKLNEIQKIREIIHDKINELEVEHFLLNGPNGSDPTEK